MLKSRPTPSASTLDAQGSPPSNPARSTMTAWRTARLLIVPTALLATVAFSCSDDDESVITPTGGSGGQTSNGGSAGIGGSGGNGGSGVAGAAGAAGSGGSAGSGAGAGGSAGTAGNAGAAGTAGAAGVGNDPDAGDGGPDPDSGTVQLTAQEQTADAQCAALDAIASCQAPASDCRQTTVDGWNGLMGLGCDTEVNAYQNCLGSDPTAVTDCLGGSGSDSPEYINQTGGGCEDEQSTMCTCFGGC